MCLSRVVAMMTEKPVSDECKNIEYGLGNLYSVHVAIKNIAK